MSAQIVWLYITQTTVLHIHKITNARNMAIIVINLVLTLIHRAQSLFLA